MQTLSLQVGQTYLLRLPKSGPHDNSLDAGYWAHDGQPVVVTHVTPAAGSYDLECCDIRADDGWTGIVFAAELLHVEDGSL